MKERASARRVASRRHGKYLLIALGKAGWLVMHFGTNGSLCHFRKEEDDPPYDRLRFDLGRDHHLAYVNPRLLGRVDLVADADAFLAEEKLGPDVLGARLRRAEFARLVALRTRDIKSVLMDQTVIAGIGNLYSDNSLSGPDTPANPCRSLGPPCPRSALPHGEERFAHSDPVRRRFGADAGQAAPHLPPPPRQKGGRCPRCGGAIATLKFSGRTAYYCPHCQPVAH